MDYSYEKLKAGTTVADSDRGSEVARKFNENFEQIATKFLEIDKKLEELQQEDDGGQEWEPI